ncbi:hypothetical protein OSB04_010564 [Centaurea solstitialis]|uniref:No apical meristem-associated C-terminal domain-containing protein n=1 Tax=Centaurea solstitialis TaxID=347529 RepID=A0AA38WKS8_9ASTR|nr:hypothetical protein OSB04_010564 [Centaurea solstitialis]
MSTSRSLAYNDNEDIQLCRCYIDVSQNPIIGRNQSKDKFWARVNTEFHSSEIFATNPRPRRSLESRMSTIMKATKKLRGCIRQIQNRNPSGASEQDIMNDAKEMLKLDASYKKGFKFDHVWHLMKDFEPTSNATATPQYQRQSPYQSPSTGAGSSSGTDVGITLTQRPIGVRKAKSKLQSDKNLEALVKASKKMNKFMNKNYEVIMKRNEVQAEKNAIKQRLADDKIMFTDLNSITDLVFHEFIKNEQIQILRKRSEERRDHNIKDLNSASQHQESGEELQGSEEGVQNQDGGSQNVTFNEYYAAGGNQWSPL